MIPNSVLTPPLSFINMRFTSATLAVVALLASNVAAHSVMLSVTGANGVTGNGLGVVDATGKKTNFFDQVRFVLRLTNSC